MTALVLHEVSEGTAAITLNAPDRYNAVDTDMLDELAALIERFDADPQVRVITLTGAGKAFCSGATLELVDGKPSVGPDTLTAIGRVIRGMVGSATPILAIVGGVAAGVGVSLALAADYLLASESASFVLAFAKVGLMPDGGATGLVAANIGRARAMRMALTAERVTGPVAAEWGLVSELVDADELSTRASELAQLLASSSPLAVARTTSAINAATLDLDAILAREQEGQVFLLGTADFQEGAIAFNDKRPPRFQGA